MDNPTALEQARALCVYGPHDIHNGCRQCNRIAAALKRAYADGMQFALECELAAEMGSLNIDSYRSPEDIRAEADQLEGK